MKAVRVEYEELPAVFTLAAALAPGAPLVQDLPLRGADPRAETNVLTSTSCPGVTSRRPWPGPTSWSSSATASRW